MKDVLTSLSKKEGFKSQIVSSDSWIYSLKEDLRYILWLTELWEWLLKEHKIFVIRTFQESSKTWGYKILPLDKFHQPGYEFYTDHIEYNDPQEALEMGLYQALILKNRRVLE